MNHREIDLTNRQIQILKYYSKHPNDLIGDHAESDIDKLVSLELLSISNQTEIDYDIYINEFYGPYYEIQPQLFALTINGEMFLDHHRKDLIRTYLPITISILALAISVISLIKTW